jgi:CYTH domain-containing protein
MNIEIERKFLLKAIPEPEPIEKIQIDQWYFKNESGIWERARKCESDVKGIYYIHTIKKTLEKGINLEDEKIISELEFETFVSQCNSPFTESKYISKERWVYPQEDLKWEVDIFHSGHYLIVAEIEIPEKDYKLSLPNFIKEKLIIEVTGIKQFSNKSLSNPINKIKNKKKSKQS